jgi:hypothetical protein
MDFNFDRSRSRQPLRSRQLSQNSRPRHSKDPRFFYNSSLMVTTGSSDTHAFTEPQNRNYSRLNLGFGCSNHENWHRRSHRKEQPPEVPRGAPVASGHPPVVLEGVQLLPSGALDAGAPQGRPRAAVGRARGSAFTV